MTATTVKVCVVGLGERATKRLTSFLYEIADDLCDVVDEDNAEVSILDIDSAQFDWAQYLNRHPGQPVILLAKDRPDLEGMFWVPKPIMEVALIEALNWARSAAQSGAPVRRKGTQSGLSAVDRRRIEIDVEGSTSFGLEQVQPASDVRFYRVTDTLLQIVTAAFRRSETSLNPVLIEIADAGRVVIYPEADTAYCDLGIETLATFARSGPVAGECRLAELEPGEARLLSEELGGATAMESSDLLWRLGVWCSDGRLPEGTDLEDRYYLRCWPNFTRLMEIPEALRITALWVREPATFDFLVQSLGVTYDDLYTFYSAAHAVGLAGPARREVDYLLANSVRQDNEGSRFNAFVRRIGRHLGGAG